MKRLAALLLCLLPLAGCRTWDVRAFDVPLNGKEPRLMAATDDSGLSTDEKLGVILIVGLAVGGSIAVAAASH